jgi:hypothetical protein
MAYLPLKTPAHVDSNQMAVDQLQQNFPFFFMFTFLIPLFYLVSKLAEEKESKSREGMKMMGLKDSAYFLSWFAFFFIIILFMSLVILGMLSINVFSNSNGFLVFMLALLYGMSLFGFAIIIVSFMPTVRSSATTASLLHIVTYFLVFAVKSEDFPVAGKIVVCIFPNLAMSLAIFNLYHFESDSNGMSFELAGSWYNNFTFNIGLSMLAFDAVFYLCLGLYLDKVLKSQYGVAQKWNFICTRSYWCGNRRRGGNQSKEDLEKLL